MKKIIAYLFIFCISFGWVGQVFAYDSYWTSPVKNKNITYTTDLTPRISYWYGKVNQHVDTASRTWQTDPDGYSGATIDKLEYCKKFYPNTLYVENYKSELISSWRGMGNVNYSTGVQMSYKCVQGIAATSLAVVSPKLGDTYNAGDKILVTWNSVNIPNTANLGIYLWSNNTSNNYEIISSTYVLNNGRGEIIIPNSTVSGKYKISVTSTPFGGNNSAEFNIVGQTLGNIPVITSISGPQSLNTNQMGTWMIKASSSNGGNLSYSVDWGDFVPFKYCPSGGGPCSMVNSSPNSQQSATFTHTYLQSGTYTPTFTVTSENTIRCVTTPCPSNGGSAKTSLNLRVLDSNNGNNTQIVRTLRHGMVGDDVKKLQVFLGIYADGVYGNGTFQKVKAWQILNNLNPDGVFGYQSRTKMGI